MNHKSTGKADETQKAKKLINKDIPNTENSADHEALYNQEPKPFRPDENVDNQKDEKDQLSPAHNTSIEETPIPGVQLTEEKKTHKDNINQKTKKHLLKAINSLKY